MKNQFDNKTAELMHDLYRADQSATNERLRLEAKRLWENDPWVRYEWPKLSELQFVYAASESLRQRYAIRLSEVDHETC